MQGVKTIIFTAVKKAFFTASNTAVVAVAIGLSAMPAQAQSDKERLFQSVSGNDMIEVAKERGRACSIGQYRDNQGISAMKILYDRFGAPRLTVIVPNYPGYRQGNYDIRFDISNGSASFDITVPKMSVSNPGAGSFVLTRDISRDEAAALLISGTVTATTGDGSRILSLSAPLALRSAAMREYDACKGTIGDRPR